ncbi:MAG: tetratricopeptide repeat protein [Lachnospiraceae bacterium]
MSKKMKKRIKILVVLLVLAAAAGFLFTRWRSQQPLREGVAALQQENYSQAIRIFQNAAAHDSLNKEYCYYLGMAYLSSGSYEDAEKQFSLALNLDQNYEAVYRGLGILRYQQERYEEAVDYFNQALDSHGLVIGDMEYDILRYRMNSQAATGDYEGALETCASLMELAGESSELDCCMGNYYCRMGRKEEAMQAYDKAVVRGNASYSMFWEMYDSLNEAGWTDQAVTYLEMTETDGCISTDNITAAELRRNRGMAAYYCGRYEEAIKFLGDVALASDVEALTYLALAYEANGNRQSALKILKTQANGSTNPYDYQLVAEYYIKYGEAQRAVNFIRRGINACTGKDVRTLEHTLVTAYEAGGQYEQAMEALKEYQKKYGNTGEIEAEIAYIESRL